MKYYLAIDIGASSGRHIVGHIEDGKIVTEEVYRFENRLSETDGHLIWDIDKLEMNVRIGIDMALDRFSKIESLSIDTWGVDYVLIDNDEPILPVCSYRDDRTSQVIDEVHLKVSFDELYEHTGTQFQPFNTIYQLYHDKKTGRLDKATDFLMIPEYLLYRLTSNKVHEYTNASTTGLLSAKTGSYDESIIDKLGLKKRLFTELSYPGKCIGEYKEIKVLLCATHDTGSAVEGIPMDEDQPYISSGTWSLLGVKTDKAITDKASQQANYSNEGGVGYNRYQKNIMGMWLINSLKDELCKDSKFDEMISSARQSSYDYFLDANDQTLLAPQSMKEAFDSLLPVRPESIGDYFRCAISSLANGYRKAIEELEKNTNKTYHSIYIVGGGANNSLLNEMTEALTGKKIIAIPIEATALGNLKIQMEADK